MDKSLNRKILFDKKGKGGTQKITKASKLPLPVTTEKPPQTEIKFTPTTEANKAAKIVSWINDHPEFKWSAMCLKIGIDKSNFKRVLDSATPMLKNDQIIKIGEFLKNYGYAE